MANTPPNLRLSQGKMHCGNCSAGGNDGTVCTMFDNYPVEPDLVCNNWAPGEGAEDVTSGDDS